MLTGEKMILRAPKKTDLPLLVSLRNDVDIQLQLLALPRANTGHKVEEWLNRSLSDPKTIFFVIADKDSDELRGFVQIKEIDLINRVGELGICLTTDAQGKGLAEDVMRVLEAYGKNVFNLRKIILQVLVSNKRAVNFYLRNGFKRVGVLSENHYQNGTFQDVLLMEKFI